MLYAAKKPMAGFEPTTSRLLSGCSTAKLHWRASNWNYYSVKCISTK